jgi:hypothetical protein
MAPDGDIHRGGDRRWKRLPGIDAGSRLRSRQAGRRLCGQINERPRAPVGNGSTSNAGRKRLMLFQLSRVNKNKMVILTQET